ncbi:MAG: hypothetical protein OJF61_001211 [Rhodanobacteraceae bacterium]|nr:MAG: hypothetical protein OJF61_001211 [Rhodanobacteraceae bacterium]
MLHDGLNGCAPLLLPQRLFVGGEGWGEGDATHAGTKVAQSNS